MSGIRRLRKALAFSPWRPPHHLAAILNLFLEDYSQINLAPRRFQVEKKSFCRLLLLAITILYDVSECISSSPIFPLMVHYSYFFTLDLFCDFYYSLVRHFLVYISE